MFQVLTLLVRTTQVKSSNIRPPRVNINFNVPRSCNVCLTVKTFTLCLSSSELGSRNAAGERAAALALRSLVSLSQPITFEKGSLRVLPASERLSGRRASHAPSLPARDHRHSPSCTQRGH